jgi:hypothetical protein
VVDFGEDHPAISFLGLYGSLESLNRLLNRVIARLGDQPGFGSVSDGQHSHEESYKNKGSAY